MSFKDTVKSGDKVTIDPLWNDSTGYDFIDVPTTVLAVVRNTYSQSGVKLLVKTRIRKAWIDSAWFNREKPLRESKTFSDT
jgi:hypothetical protein